MIDDKRIYFGGSIKAAGNGIVEGMLIAFTDADTKDLHGEYFSKTTDLHLADFPIESGLRVLYQHGLDDTMGIRKVGQVMKAKIDEAGVWLQAQLDMRDEYEEAIYKLAESGKLGWSSGALPQSVKVADDGLITDWAVIEASLTPTPAMPMMTGIQTIKSIQTAKIQGTKEPNGAKESSVPSADVDNPNLQARGLKTMDEQAIRDVVRMTIEELKAMDEGQEEQFPPEEEVVRGIEPEIAKMDEEMDDEQKSVQIAKLTADFVVEKFKAEQRRKDAIRNAAKASMNGYAASQPVDANAYLPTAQHSNNGKAQQITVSEPLKYAHLSALDMAMAWKMATAASPFGRLPTGLQGRNATDFVSEEFYRTAVHKMSAQIENTRFSRAEDALYVKSITPFKANELDASDITGQGLEYLGNVYDTTVWETARNNRIYKLMLGRGMMEKQVPQGMKNVVVPVEGNDPSVYGGVEGNSTDATGRPEVVYKITPQTTSTVTVTPGTFRTATAYTFELGEDSFVDMAAESNRKVTLSLEEHIEKAMINADTETAASTNINDIAGTPTSTGLTRDYFLEFNGLRKSPLVTSTAYSRDGGALAVDDYRKTWALLGSTIAPRKNNIFFLIDFNTFNASLDLLPVLTRDVAGEDNSLFTGEFESLWGLPVYMSGFLALSNSAGKIDLDTPGNNTKGQILAVYAPYWAFVFKRNITIEMQRSPDSETYEFYGSMRFALTRRSADAAAISYNLTV